MIALPSNFTPESYIDDFWRYSYRPIRQGGASPRTLEDYESQLGIFNRIFQTIRSVDRRSQLQDLSDELLAEAMAYRVHVEKKSKATANKLHKVICPIWRFASQRKKILNTLPFVDLYDVPERVKAVPTPAEFELILQACQKADYMIHYRRHRIPARIFWPALLAMDVNTGTRINALMSIRKQDCDIRTQHRVLVRGEFQKHGRDEWYQLLPRTLELIEPMWAFHTENLFPWPFDKSEFQWTTLRRHFRRILERAGLPASSEHMFHCFRRYTATRVAREGGLEEARKFLGHSCVSVTKRYVDPIQGTQTKTTFNAFPELMGPGPVDPSPPPATPPGRPHLRLFDAG